MGKIIYLIIFISLIYGCTSSNDQGEFKMDELLLTDLSYLENARIYFGHQSVGYNIMDGVGDLVKEASGVSINIIDIDKTRHLPEYYFAHSKIGYNSEPNTKCEAFSLRLNDDILNNLDIALMKFCYVDITQTSNEGDIFIHYKEVIDSLKSSHPNLTIIPVTVPLTVKPEGWKVRVKNLLGREPGEIGANIKRNSFNKMLLENFPNQPIFDLATVESTYPDGSRLVNKKDEIAYFTLIPDYTYDGGHLNAYGRKQVARELIRVIANVIKNKTHQ